MSIRDDRRPRGSVCAMVVGVAVLIGPSAGTGQEYDLLLRNGRILDGTGNPWLAADVAVRDGRVVGLGKGLEGSATRVIDVAGRYVMPGIIDLHSHANEMASDDTRRRSAPNLVTQGVTTLVLNQDGRSPWPIADQRVALAGAGTGPNTILLVGHGEVRRQVMGDDFRRPATDDEVAEMRALLRVGLSEGAWGMSAGHEYVPMIWSTTDEVVALVNEVAAVDGIYIVHERSSGSQPMWWWPSQDAPGPPSMIDAVEETIEVAERTGVRAIQTHIKARGTDFWGSARVLVRLIQDARDRGVRIWADAYSYNTTGTDGNTVLIPPWVREGARRGVPRDTEPDYALTVERLMDHPDSAAMIRRDVQHEIGRRGGADNLLILESLDSALVGRTLGDVADAWNLDPVETAVQLQIRIDRSRPGGVRLRGFSLWEPDLELFYAQPWVATASDAGVALPEDGFVHPRYYGTFPRRLHRFAVEKGVTSLADAVRSMTSLPAQILDLPDRGTVRVGNVADLVVFDARRIRDMATALDPHRFSEGVDYVFVGGTAVVEDGRATGALPGTVLARPH